MGKMCVNQLGSQDFVDDGEGEEGCHGRRFQRYLYKGGSRWSGDELVVDIFCGFDHMVKWRGRAKEKMS